MLRRIAGKALCLGRDERGVALVLFVIVITPILILIAVAIDFSQFLVMKQQLQAAADSAALDVGKNPSLTDAQATAQAQAYIAANYPAAKSIGTLTSVSVTRPTTTTVNVTAKATMNTSFLQFMGYNTLPVTVSSQTSIAQNKMEVVLVLDNTGSMKQNYGSMTGIAGLQAASTALVNTLFSADPTGQYVKIAVVPFTAAVNVGTQYKTASWIDTKGLGRLTRENLNVPAGEGLITFASQLKNASWGGCVRQRYEPYDLEDVAPSSATPDTLFTPYFAPSEPQGLYNHYLPDGGFPSGTTQAQIQYDVTKYQNGVVQGQPNYGPNFTCAVQPIIPLTNDQTAILAEINAMQASGATVIPAGLVWGWHVISPIVAPVLFPSNAYQPVSYTDTNTIKVIILLTDGEADVQLTYNYQPPTGPTNGFDKSIYNAYGYGTGPHLNILALPGTLLGVQDQPDYNLDQKEIALCNNIKAVAGASGNPGRILIYAIGFGSVIDNSSLQLLQQCATNSSTYFYNPTSDELVTTFQSIAVGLNELRLSQ
ncbi:MAG: TadE/TadG family type IV pilus assembly protein [Rhodomicrobium sp.]